MKIKGKRSTKSARRADNQNEVMELGYPSYPPAEDIFVNDKEEGDLNPEDLSSTKSPNENPESGGNNVKDSHDEISGRDLDVPGSELDDAEEGVGREDEENNYYSLGGDNHNDLDEAQGY